MTAARAVSEFAHRIVLSRILDLLVLTGLVILGMASGAIRCVGRRAPRYDLRIVGMTGNTGQIASVIARVIRRAVSEG